MKRKSPFQRRCLGLGLLLMLAAVCLQMVNCAAMRVEPWDKKDWQAAGVMVLGRGADMLSTHDAVRRGARETNPFMKEHPDADDLALWWAGTSLLCLAIGVFLPPETRRAFFHGVGGLSGVFAVKNYFETR